MTSLLSVRRRAEEFATAVDGKRAPDAPQPAGVAELVGVVTALRAHEDVSPRAEFTDTLRDRLMAEAATVLGSQTANLVLPVRPRGVRERRLVAAASAIVLIGGSAGMAAAAQDALPGEALYPIKRVIERAQADLSVSPAGKGRDLLGQADDRLDEVEVLLGNGSATDAPRVPRTLEDFTHQAQEGSGLLLSSFRQTRDPGSVVTVREFAASGITVLQKLAESAPSSARSQLADAALALQEIDQKASAACSTCAADLPDLQVPGIFLASAEVDRAMRNLEGVHLNNDHPVVADKGAVKKAADAAVRQAKANAPAAPDAAVPSPTLPALPTPAAPGTKGPGSKDHVKNPPGAAENPGEIPGQVVGGLEDGLSGVVETLLPDLPTEKLLP